MEKNGAGGRGRQKVEKELANGGSALMSSEGAGLRAWCWGMGQPHGDRC